MILEILPPLASLVSGLFLVCNHCWLNSHFIGGRERGLGNRLPYSIPVWLPLTGYRNPISTLADLTTYCAIAFFILHVHGNKHNCEFGRHHQSTEHSYYLDKEPKSSDLIGIWTMAINSRAIHTHTHRRQTEAVAIGR